MRPLAQQGTGMNVFGHVQKPEATHRILVFQFRILGDVTSLALRFTREYFGKKNFSSPTSLENSKFNSVGYLVAINWNGSATLAKQILEQTCLDTFE